MNYISILCGLFAFTCGSWVFLLRIKNQARKLKKLEAMKGLFGTAAGNIIHSLFYIIMPIMFGCIATYLGIKGVSIF